MPRRPLEIINAVVVVILLVLEVLGASAGRLPNWPALLIRLVLMGGLVVAMALLARREERLAKTWQYVVNFYPLLLVPMVFDTVGYLIPAVSPVERDGALIAIDHAIFGTHPTLWLQKLIWPPVADLMYLGYATYYFFPVVVGIALWRRDPKLSKAFVFTIALGFYTSYVGYFLVPAKGPRTAQASEYRVPIATGAISRAISGTLDSLENTKHDAFPSGHTMITVMCVAMAARYARRVFWVILPVGLVLIAATMYCRYHYVIDVLAGLALAAVALPGNLALYAWMERGARQLLRLSSPSPLVLKGRGLG